MAVRRVPRSTDGQIDRLAVAGERRRTRAGDVRRGSVERVASAVGDGATAVRVMPEHLLEAL